VISWTTLGEVLAPLTKRSPLQQGWSPQCETHPAGEGSWGVLKTTSIQAGHFLGEANKQLPANLDPRPALEVLPGDLLITCAGPRSRCGVPTLVRSTRSRLMISGKMYRFRTIETMDPRFLELYLLSSEAQRLIDSMKTGISESGLNLTKARFLALPVPIAPMDEQRQIVEILEDHLSRLDAANTAIRRAALRVRQLVKASSTTIINRAESDNRTATLRLEDIASLGSGTTPARGNPRYWDQGTIPWVTSGDLSQGVITSSSQFVTDAALSETSLRILPAGTLLVAMYGEGKTRGTVGELAIDATSNQACAAITLNNSNTTHRSWLRLVLESRYETLRRQSSGGVQPNLNIGLLRNLTVPWPTAEHAATLVDEHRRTIDMARRLETGLRTNLLRSRSLHRALLAAAFSGQLTGTPPELGKIAEQVAASGAH